MTIVHITSTWEPGYRNPATPTISLDFIAVALIPGGILVDSPIPDPSSPRSLFKMGSFAPSERIKGCPRTSSFFVQDPGRGTSLGQSSIVISFSDSATPAGKSFAAATIWVTGRCAPARKRRNTTQENAVANIAAIRNASMIRFAFVNHLRQTALPAQNKAPAAIATPKGTRFESDDCTFNSGCGCSPDVRR